MLQHTTLHHTTTYWNKIIFPWFFHQPASLSTALLYKLLNFIMLHLEILLHTTPHCTILLHVLHTAIELYLILHQSALCSYSLCPLCTVHSAVMHSAVCILCIVHIVHCELIHRILCTSILWKIGSVLIFKNCSLLHFLLYNSLFATLLDFPPKWIISVRFKTRRYDFLEQWQFWPTSWTSMCFTKWGRRWQGHERRDKLLLKF